MKRNYVIGALILVLAVVAVILSLSNKRSTIKKELRDFAIEDTASIDKIFMVKKDYEQVTLTRDGDHWTVNDNFVARPEAIDILLKTLNRIRVKSPVSKSAYNNVVTMLATRNTKVEVYRQDKLIKTLYVGGPTQDQMGTFMMIEGSSAPFVVHIPGFIGYLSTRFFTNENEWRSQVLFTSKFDQLKHVEIINNEDPQQSFAVDKHADGRIDLYQLSTQQKPVVLDTVGVNFFLSGFEKILYEFYVDTLPTQIRDSLESAVPMRTLYVSNQVGKELKVDAHRRYANGKLDVDGNPLIWDDERMYAKINDSGWVVIQYYIFNKLFRNYNEFTGMPN